MAFRPSDASEISQLSKAVGYSRSQMKPFRENRSELLKEYVGAHYSDSGATDKVPVNLLELAMNIYLQRLVAQSPAVLVNTDYAKLRETAIRFELAINHLIKEIDLCKSLELAVTGAMLCMGVVKVGLNHYQIEVGGVLHDSGQPFCDFVSLDDWVHDMTVDNLENAQYEGNFYYVTEDEAEAMFPDKIDKLIPVEQQNIESKGHSISESDPKRREEFRKTIRLLDLWLPKQNLILQCQASDDDSDPISSVLRVIEWNGPERGPYHKLGFSVVESNTIPLAPAMLWRDLHELANRLFRKLGRQADREKTITTVQQGHEDDGRKINECPDGEAVVLGSTGKVEEQHYGGISAQSLGFLLTVKDLYGYLAGNLDMLGGLGPQSETLGQDQLLSASASMRVQKMQKAVYAFTAGIVEDLGYYLWNDPYITIPVTKRVKGFDDISVTVPFGPEQRENDFVEYNIKIEPYSMQYNTPEAKLQGIRTVFSEIIAPMMPIMEAQGITVDFESLFRKISKLGNLPELQDILIYSSPNHEREPVGNQPGKAPVTKRTY
ncbi:MAG: hypothetical protein PHQ00_04990 [Phycisphaerae bacterium]|nr:hypothetical protein [Phycisphaerae bacterium]